MTHGDANSRSGDPAEGSARLAALERPADILNAAGEGIYALDPQGRVTFVNAAAERLLGWSAHELLGQAMHAAIHYARADGAPYFDAHCRIHATVQDDAAPRESGVEVFWCRDGAALPVIYTRTIMLDAGKPAGVVVVFRDATETQRAEQALRDSEAQLRLITDSVPALIAYVDTERRYRFNNKAHQEWFGRRPEHMVGKHLREVMGETAYRKVVPYVEKALAGERVSFEAQVPYDLGPSRYISATYIPDHDERGKVKGYMSLINDITARKRSEERLSHLANYDTLTNLPNRVLFMDRLHQALAQAPRHERPVAVLFLDLDRFKNINDSLGHDVGDLLLKEVAQRLSGCVRESDTVARLSGDEFVVMLSEIARPADAAQLAQKLVLAIHQPFAIGGQILTVDASVGVALYPRDAEDAGTLLKNADTAMYRAKERGRNQYREYSKSMGARAARRLTLANDLRRALKNDEFELRYQPQVDLSSRRIVAAEVYLRWRRPGWDRLVRPSDFLDEAEARGLTVPISEWVLRAACEQHRLWQEQGWPSPRVTVHLSAPQVHQSNLVKTVSQILKQTPCAASALELQLSENLLHAPEVERVVRSLKQRGVRIAVGNIGHSALSYLKRLSVDNLKIDRAFMRDMPGDPNKSAAVAAIVATARALQVTVTAEGVETGEQLELLRALGCDAAQGFLLGKPMPANELTKRLSIEGSR